MANIKSAQKRVLVAERNRKRNSAFKSAVRTAVKKVLVNLKAGTPTDEPLKSAFSIIDRAILKGILHKNTGSRMKSRLALKIKNTASKG